MMLILLVLGVFIPLVLLLYPTRIGTWVGERWRTGRVRYAGKTFIEAFQGSYKDGTNGERDYRIIPGLFFFVMVLMIALYAYCGYSSLTNKGYMFLAIFVVACGLVILYGLAKPYKTRRHNLYSAMIFSVMSALSINMYIITTSNRINTAATLIVLSLLPLAVVVLYYCCTIFCVLLKKYI